MAVEKRVETLEGEIKLMKGELKETLTNVRDFLLGLKLPPSQIEGLETGDSSRLAIDGGLSLISPVSIPQPPVSVPQSPVREPREPREPREVIRERLVPQPVEPDWSAAPSVAGGSRPTPVWRAVPSPVRVIREPSQPEMGARAPGQFMEAEAPPQPPVSEPSEQAEQEEPSQPEEVAGLSGRRSGEWITEPVAKPVTEPVVKPVAEPVTRPVTRPVSESTSQVNLLINLLRWVSTATREIGIEQLPTLLDVYGTAGNISPEMREVILSFAGIVEKQPADIDSPGVWGHLMGDQLATFLEMHSANGNVPLEVKEGILRLAGSMGRQSSKSIADIWSRLILELHGILTGGGIPLRPLRPVAGAGGKGTGTGKVEAVAGVELVEPAGEKPRRLGKSEPAKSKKSRRLKEDRPVALKLVLPGSGGVEKEFSINLTPEVDGED